MSQIEMEYLSHSRLEVFRSCQRLFKLRYIDKSPPENDTTEYYARYGSLTHRITEEFYRSNGFVSKSVLTDWFYNGIDDGDDSVVGYRDVGVPDTYNKNFDCSNRDLYYQQGLDYIERLARTDVSKTIGVEVEFRVKIADGVPEAYGFIDRIDRDENGITVVDYKSSAPYTQSKCDNAPQMSIYALAVYDMYGEYPYRYIYDFIRFNERVITYRSEEQLEQFKRQIVKEWDDICNSTWEPNYNWFYCNNFCSNRISCPVYNEKHNKR